MPNKHHKYRTVYFKRSTLIIIILITVLLNACSTINNSIKQDVKPIMVQHEIAENQLLNVSIQKFESGELPKNKEKRRGLSEEIRNSEARYIPIHLKYTLQKTGYWGNVSVLPDISDPQQNAGSEIIVKGKILNSDGERIALHVDVFDASNKKWFSKTYKETVTAENNIKTEIRKKDRFQNLYNQISNDIIKYRQKLSLADIKKIKDIAELRFANSMAPDTFSNYLGKDKNNLFYLKKLPADNDSMLQRVNTIKIREEMLVDTINNYYNLYYSDLWDSYENWRQYRSEELDTIRDLNNKALAQQLLGAAAIVGAIALGASNSGYEYNTGALESVMIAGGAYAIKAGFDTRKETNINKDAIEELDISFETEAEPILVDVNGKTMTLTGNANQQYKKWRALLSKIYREETSF
ncbi:MAG: hypothetical protein KAI79_18080 [Bacteroidales bacterium]|nr:hypothetical protein [Bacteroidales bacterium]